jgi:hypothetical protein
MNGQSIPACIGGNRSNIGACDSPRSAAVKTERIGPLSETAVQHGATFVDVSNWFCTADSCQVDINGIVVFRDEHHITDTFSRYRAPQMAQAIQAAFATR